MRCEDKGRYAKCNSCSGSFDPDFKRDPYDFHNRCRCSQGIMQITLKNGRKITTKYPGNPYKSGKVTAEGLSEDEKEWSAYINNMREKMDDENWDPIQYSDGSSTYDDYQGMKRGKTN